MKESVFNNGLESDNRRIMIRITGYHIEFFYYDQYLRQLEYLSDKIENGDIDYMGEEEKVINGFYWIGADEWISHKTKYLDREDNWHKHMKNKLWFTDEMAEFMNNNTH